VFYKEAIFHRIPSMYSRRDTFGTNSRMCTCYIHVEFDLDIENTSGHILIHLEKKEYLMISCNKFEEVFMIVK
jgi:hypothetical protein